MTKEATVPRPYRILVVDDHAVVRRGVRALLESQPGIEICCEAATGVEAVEYVRRGKPNLVLLDLTMPDMNGLEAARAIHDESPETDILILTMHFSEDVAREVLRSGARGYVLKSDADSELVAAIRHVQQHKPFFTGRLAMTMVESFVNEQREGEASNDHPLPGCPLTARELEIVQLLATGKISKEVAATVGISTRTVESHRNHIMKKMNFSSFSELMRFAIRNHLVEP
ncbi:MAG: response regulator transcription factor [Candidatus Acidiferrales bacterium]|jgi:DNA-binding NarL/FixJ family response regulator